MVLQSRPPMHAIQPLNPAGNRPGDSEQAQSPQQRRNNEGNERAAGKDRTVGMARTRSCQTYMQHVRAWSDGPVWISSQHYNQSPVWRAHEIAGERALCEGMGGGLGSISSAGCGWLAACLTSISDSFTAVIHGLLMTCASTEGRRANPCAHLTPRTPYTAPAPRGPTQYGAPGKRRQRDGVRDETRRSRAALHCAAAHKSKENGNRNKGRPDGGVAGVREDTGSQRSRKRRALGGRRRE